MASAAPLADTKEKCNGTKLARLLIDSGTDILRRTFDSIHSPANLQAALHTKKPLLCSLLKKRILNSSQWDKLCPPGGAAPDSKTFDITLLFGLLRNICGLTAPASGWDALPPAADVSREANLARIKYYRNQVYGHVTGTGVSDAEFERYWNDISGALIALGCDQVTTDLLKSSAISETDYMTLLEKWVTNEEQLKDIVREEFKKVDEKFEELGGKVANVEHKIDTKLNQKVDCTLVALLSKCEFTGHISSLLDQYHEGTRLWALRRTEEFCAMQEATSRAVVITAPPGVGKSVLAAVVCEEARAKGRLAACHFIQHNNSRRNNPRVVIESVARHLCDSIEGFEENLENQLLSLQPEVRKQLNEMNLETLCSVLIEDPLSKIQRLRESTVSIVIDALDECELSARDEFVKVLLSKVRSMPSWIKFIVTNRPTKLLLEELPHVTVNNIEATERSNTEDIELFLVDQLQLLYSSSSKDQVQETARKIAARSSGIFLYAHFVFETAKSRRLSLHKISEIFPNGIASVYEEYIVRSRAELKVEEEKFIRFLEAVVAAEAPLPESLVLQILGIKQTSRQEKKEARQALKSLELLFPVKEKHISIFHKSLSEWLTEGEDGNESHYFSVTVKDGHRVLAEHCLKILRDVKKHKEFPHEVSEVENYALTFGFHHMLSAGGYQREFMECLQDLQLLSLMLVTHKRNSDKLCEEIRLTFWRFRFQLDAIIRECKQPHDIQHTIDMLGYLPPCLISCPQIFLQLAANGPAKSRMKSEAIELLNSSKYQECAWIEESTIFHQSSYQFVSLSSNEKTVACLYLHKRSTQWLKDNQHFADGRPRYSLMTLNVETGEQLSSVDLDFLVTFHEVFGFPLHPRIQISPDDRYLAAPVEDYSEIELRDIRRLEVNKKLKPATGCCLNRSKCCFLQHGQIAAVCTDSNICIWDIESGDIAVTLSPPFGMIPTCMDSPTGQLLAIVHISVALWQSFDTFTPMILTPHLVNPNSSSLVSFSRDGELVACTCSVEEDPNPKCFHIPPDVAVVKIFSTSSGQLLNQFQSFQTREITFIDNINVFVYEEPAVRSGSVVNGKNSSIRKLAFPFRTFELNACRTRPREMIVIPDEYGSVLVVYRFKNIV